MGDKTKVLLVEDHPLVCEAMAALINSQTDLVVCGQAASLQEGLRAAARVEPDLAIVDLAHLKEDRQELTVRLNTSSSAKSRGRM